jgi:peptidoglycan/LPS O-acetylase OafA/YrhL
MRTGLNRLRFLDGLRGWAAVVVLLHHIFVDGIPADSLMADRTLWAKVVFLNGPFAVCIFFVVSGLSLSVRYLETGDDRGLVRLAAGRYLRLALPIFAICAMTYALLLLGIIPPAAQRPSPLDLFVAFAPTLKGLLSFSLVDVFVSYSPAESYNPPLWTMSYELFGSFMVFAIVAMMRWERVRIWAVGALFVGLAACQSYFALFVAGIFLADLFQRCGRWKSSDASGATLFAAGLILTLLLHPWFNLLYIAAATCLTAGITLCAPVRRLFENRLGDFLGWISFPLYLVQAAVIYSFSVHGLDLLGSLGFEHSAQRWIIGAATVPVAIVFAIAFCPINDMAVTLSRRFGSAFCTLYDQIAARYFAHETRRLSSSREQTPSSHHGFT